MTCLIAWKHSAILYLISSFNCIYHKPQLISFSPLFLSWSWFLTDSFFYFRMTGRFSVIHCYVQVKLQQVCWGLVWALTFTQCLTGLSIFHVMVKLQGKQVLPKQFQSWSHHWEGHTHSNGCHMTLQCGEMLGNPYICTSEEASSSNYFFFLVWMTQINSSAHIILNPTLNLLQLSIKQHISNSCNCHLAQHN